MFLGHYATALIPYEKTRDDSKSSFWLFLLAAQFLDFLMFTLTGLGLEAMSPHQFMNVSFASMKTNMFISHDILPVLGWAIVFGLVVYLFTKSKKISLWCFVLVVFHEVCDLVVGFEHRISGEGTPSLGLNLYQEAPITGLFLEALFCGGIVFWFIRARKKANKPVSARLKWTLYGTLVGGTLATLPMANKSLSFLFGLG